MALWSKKKKTPAATPTPAPAAAFQASAAPKTRFEQDQKDLEDAWKTTDLSGKVDLLNGLTGDRFSAIVVGPSWIRDTATADDYKAPIMIAKVTIDAQAAGEQTRTTETMTVSFSKDASGDHVYGLESDGLAGGVSLSTPGKNAAINAFEAWRADVQAKYNLTALPAAMTKKAAAFTNPVNPPVQPTAKP